jgi:hypothetical protein
VPDLVNDYDIIGFDLESTLVKFNNVALARLLIESHLKELVESYGYPKEILMFDYEEYLPLCLNNSVWDTEHGVVLKLAEDKQIFHAMSGLSKLTDKDIFNGYGNPPKFTALKWPQASQRLDKKIGSHMTFMGLMECYKAAVVCWLTECINEELFKDKQVVFDVNEVAYKQLNQL